LLEARAAVLKNYGGVLEKRERKEKIRKKKKKKKKKKTKKKTKKKKKQKKKKKKKNKRKTKTIGKKPFNILRGEEVMAARLEAAVASLEDWEVVEF